VQLSYRWYYYEFIWMFFARVLWNLDLCVLLIPALAGLTASKYSKYVLRFLLFYWSWQYLNFAAKIENSCVFENNKVYSKSSIDKVFLHLFLRARLTWPWPIYLAPKWPPSTKVMFIGYVLLILEKIVWDINGQLIETLVGMSFPTIP